MRPAFSNALYYPSIDIKNTDWLKTALLFWDSVSTIVPESYDNPYKNPDTQFLAEIGFLQPLFVNSQNKSVVGIEKDIIDLMLSPEFKQLMFSQKSGKSKYILRGKMSFRIAHLLYKYNHKDQICEEISNRVRYINSELDSLEPYFFPDEFVNTYMLVLANRLCEDHSLGLITDDAPCFNFCETVRFNNQTTNSFNHHLTQGLLLNYVIDGLSISPENSFEDIFFFKEHHKDELGRFRTQLAKFTKGCEANESINAIQQEISDLYVNEFLPAYNDFKKALNSSKVKWFTDTFMKVSTLSVGATSVPTALLGMPIEKAVLAGIGVSVIASAVSYDANKKEVLRNSPYSYLLSMGKAGYYI